MNKKMACFDCGSVTAEYDLAGYNYTLRDLDGGFAMGKCTRKPDQKRLYFS